MTVRLRHLWATLRSSYWFVPSLMTVAAGVLAVGTVLLDRSIDREAAEDFSWVFSGGPDGARAVLEVIASSVMTTAGIIFSVTIAALSLASSQLGPRILQNFMRDTGNQVVLGTFIGTYVFCLLVLRTIRGEDFGDFVPPISVTVGLLLALASLGVLIYFIHHVAISIQAPTVVAQVGAELATHVERTFRGDRGLDRLPRPPSLPAELEARGARVAAPRSGYVQALDETRLVELAREHGLLLVIERRPGHFVGAGAPLALAWPPERCGPAVARKVRRMFVVGDRRTPEQDVEFAADQLVEMAVRALSPSLNDPFTAVSCLDWLGAALCRAARGQSPGPLRCDGQGEPRLVFRSPLTFAALADRAFHQIRQNGAGKPAVAIRMLETIETVGRCSGGGRDTLGVLLEHAAQVHRAAAAEISDPRDLRDVGERYARVLALAGEPVSGPTSA